MSFSPEAFCMAKVSGGGGGGNPNYTEMFTGTAADVLTNIPSEKLERLYAALGAGGNAHAIIDIDATVLGFDRIMQPFMASGDAFYTNGAVIGDDFSRANDITWDFYDGEISHAYVETDGVITNFLEYASIVDAALTVYWHPMPT